MLRLRQAQEEADKSAQELKKQLEAEFQAELAKVRTHIISISQHIITYHIISSIDDNMHYAYWYNFFY